jgi:hypothetical protein
MNPKPAGLALSFDPTGGARGRGPGALQCCGTIGEARAKGFNGEYAAEPGA